MTTSQVSILDASTGTAVPPRIPAVARTRMSAAARERIAAPARTYTPAPERVSPVAPPLASTRPAVREAVRTAILLLAGSCVFLTALTLLINALFSNLI